MNDIFIVHCSEYFLNFNSKYCYWNYFLFITFENYQVVYKVTGDVVADDVVADDAAADDATAVDVAASGVAVVFMQY